MNLTAGERQSPVWFKIKEDCEKQLDLLRKQNDNDHDAVATAKIRGRIADCKRVLALGDDPPPLQEKAIKS